MPPPKSPFLQAPDAGNRWTVRITPVSQPDDRKSGAATNTKPLRSAVLWEMTLGTNHVGHGIITYSDSSQEEYYTASGSILQKCANSDRVALWPPDPRVGSEDLRVAVFPALDWLNVKNYVGIEKISGRDYFKFQIKPDYMAWIDAASRYPLKAQKKGKLYTFSAIKPFTSEVEMPAKYQASWKKLKTEINVAEILKSMKTTAH